MVHACIPSTWETETRRPQVQGKPRLYRETLSQNAIFKEIYRVLPSQESYPFRDGWMLVIKAILAI